SYILPLIMLNSESKYPWPLGIMVYRGEYGTEWQLVLAFITLTILPTIIVFFVDGAIGLADIGELNGCHDCTSNGSGSGLHGTGGQNGDDVSLGDEKD
ncbi:hypothetical protein ACC772_37690, partial [Rhizobium ruizarguesonis]